MFVLELRQANPRRQGDIGEMAAAEWLTRTGYGVWIPLCHSPNVDLIAQQEDSYLRIQVKTTTVFRNGRFAVSLATKGGNQSWGGCVKTLDAARYDYLFVLVADGRKWFIPAPQVDGKSSLLLGGRNMPASRSTRIDEVGVVMLTLKTRSGPNWTVFQPRQDRSHRASARGAVAGPGCLSACRVPGYRCAAVAEVAERPSCIATT